MNGITLPAKMGPRSRAAVATRRRRKAATLLGQILLYAVIIVLSLGFAMPLLWMVSTSLKTDPQVYRVPPIWIPNPMRFPNYPEALTLRPFGLYFVNTMRYALPTVVGTLVSSVLVAYGFAKIRWWGRDVLFFACIATMMIPFQVIMIPLYLVLVKLGITDSLLGLIVPGATSAFGIFLMRQFIESIPSELIDAARIDGASEFGIYWQVILPQMGAALATLGIFQFMGTWNDYLWPLIVITTTEKRTLPIMLTWYNSQHGSRFDLTMAASVLVILPIVVIYFFFQRWIVRGIALTGFK